MVSNEQLKQIILDQRDTPVLRDEIARSKYEEALGLANTKQILIIMGLRRSGKSTLMDQLRRSRSEQDYFINFDDERLVSFMVQDFQQLLEVFIELFGVQKTFYFDEIQIIEGWELFVRRLYEQGNKIFITGSNSKLLSKELGTHLTGRYLTLELYPYSFIEYCEFRKKPIKKIDRMTTQDRALFKKLNNEYLEEGGLPEYLESKKTDYLMMLYDSIIYRDIINRYKISQEKPIKELVLYLASNIGKTLTFNSLKKTIGISSGTTIAEYCQYLENSYLFFIVHRYSFSLKAQIQSPKKCYSIDTALAKTLGFRISQDTGRFLENLVFLELKRRATGEIYYHQEKYECDFLLRQGTQIIQAIQVTLNLHDPKTKQREYAGLLEAMKAYGLNEGLILTDNESSEETVNLEGQEYKIKVQPIWVWMS